jgi:cobalt-zinc-cadmium efflux system membrane fusion protein
MNETKAESATTRRRRPGLLGLGIALVLAVLLGAAVPLGLVLGGTKVLNEWWGTGKPGEAPPPPENHEGVELIRDDQGHPGLRLNAEAANSYDIRPVPAQAGTRPRAMPPQVGAVNYDNDRLFKIPTRFPGEVASFKQVKDSPPSIPTKFRPIRAGDNVKQGEVLAVVWSQQLGQAKAALVDAISAVRLSKVSYERQLKLWQEGVASLSVLEQARRQVQGDTNNLLTAERSLKMWKLTPEEIQEIRAEANIILDQQKVRSSDLEVKWAVVEVKVPTFDKEHPDRELTIVEKNTNLNDMLDPINSPAPLFKLADLSRVQIWVHPPEEYLPGLQKNLAKAEKEGRQLEWDIRFQSDPPDAPPRKMTIVQIYPSIEPTQHTPLVVGYLDNSEGKYLVGQYLTATIYVPPVPDTVEIPAEALNEVGGQALVFVQTDPGRREYTLRRVPVEARFKDVAVVRSKLTADDEKVSRLEKQKGRRAIEPLRPGERVLTRGVVELTTALEELLVEERSKTEGNR